MFVPLLASVACLLLLAVSSFSQTIRRESVQNERDKLSKNKVVDNILGNRKQSLRNSLQKLIEAKVFDEVPEDFFTETVDISRRDDLVQLGIAPKDFVHTVVFAIKQNNLKQLEELVNDISHPHSSNYGHHLTTTEVAELTNSEMSSRFVTNYLRKRNFEIIAVTKFFNYVTVSGTIEQLEKLMSTEFHLYGQKEGSDVTVARTTRYFLPEIFKDHITSVFNTVQFPEPAFFDRNFSKKLKTKLLNDLNLNESDSYYGSYYGYTTPQLLNSLYDIRNNTGSQLLSQAVYGGLNESLSPTDLTFFQEAFDLPIEPISHDIGGYVADNACVYNDGEFCTEANLDIQLVALFTFYCTINY